MGSKSGIKPFNVAALTKVNFMDPKDVGYQDSIDIIYDELHKTRKSFIKIGWYLKHINEAEMYKEDGYVNIYEFAHDKFNISQSTATRFINLCNEFSVDHNSPELDEKYLDFSVSQLFEMLPMKKEQKEQITPDMTVKEIREIKNESKSVIKNNVSEEDDNVPGQTSIEKDFPEYLPDDIYVESEVAGVIETNIEIEEEHKLRDEIETLADNVRRVFGSWNAAKKMPRAARNEIIEAKENALKLANAIEKLLDMIS